ncbi:MAG: hypothetical protein DRP42_05115 [Tenericutes bacterium]|nr:MAG: hypothetical protein DRP42_05115 [Mycoplasmatota bacterium]
MDNYLHIKDLVTFDFLNPDLTRIKDDFDNARGPFKVLKDTDIKNLDSKGLKVKIAATHAGIVTGNNMFYLPDKVRKGAPTLLEDYGKPILKHHDEDKDCIGRVIDSVYVDTSGVIKDVLKDSFIQDSHFSESSFKDFCDGKMPFSYQVDFVRKNFDKLINDKTSTIQNGVYIGLGHIQIVCDITDPDAIQKFLDGRFLTGSIGARTNRAVCSVCKQNWTEDGSCEHDPGGVYDGKKCVLIAGDFFYDEYSVVNSPADRQSRVLELYYNGNLKDIEVKNGYEGSVYEVKLGFPQYDKEESTLSMAKQDKKEEKKIEDSVKKEEVEKTVPEEKVESKEDKGEKVEDKVSEEVVVEELSLEDSLAQIMDKEEFSAEESDKIYDMMFQDQADLEDSKLSAEKREKLAKSAFCGPDKSFPASDCAHVTAIRRLVDKYKGSGDTKKILASVNRKAKAMGCDKKTKDAIQHAQVLQMLAETIKEHLYTQSWRKEDGKEPILSDEDVKSLSTVMKNLVTMVGKDNFAGALSSGEKELKDVVKYFQDIDLLDEIISLEETMGGLRGELTETVEQRDAINEEFELLKKDSDAVRDELIEEKKNLRDFQVEKMSLLTSLKDGKATDEQKEGWLSLTDEALETSLGKLTEEVDIKKMADKLNDGTSRNPEGEVEDPTLSYEDMSTELKEKITAIERAAFDNFRDIRTAELWKNVKIQELLEEAKLSKDL